MRLSGENREEGYAVYKIREIAFGGSTKLSAEDGFLQFMIERLLASNAPTEANDEEEQEGAREEVVPDGLPVSSHGQAPALLPNHWPWRWPKPPPRHRGRARGLREPL